jgi:hypothetical protein
MFVLELLNYNLKEPISPREAKKKLILSERAYNSLYHTAYNLYAF